MFIYDLSIFLTSTAFVDTNAKYGIPLLRYTVFFENYPFGYDPNSAVCFFVYFFSFLCTLEASCAGTSSYLTKWKVKSPLPCVIARRAIT